MIVDDSAIRPLAVRRAARVRRRIGGVEATTWRDHDRHRFSPVMLAALLIALVAGMAFGAEQTAPLPFAPVQEGFTTTATEVLPYAPDRLLSCRSAREAWRSRCLALRWTRAPARRCAVGSPAIDELAQDAGIVSIERPYIALRGADKGVGAGVDRWFMFHFEEIENLPSLADEFAALDDVQAVSLDWRAFPMATPSDPDDAADWGHNNTAQLPGLDWGGTYDHTLSTTVGTVGFDANAPQAWDAAQGYGSASIVIAIIDSGSGHGAPGHPQGDRLRLRQQRQQPERRFGEPGDRHRAAPGVRLAINSYQRRAGAAPGCSIMPLKVADNAGSMYFSAIQNALYYAADNGAKIISMSLGAAISTDAATNTAIQYAYNAGCTILAATGNENKTVISYPAINTYVIGVGAASPCGDRKRSSSSSTEVNPGVSTDPRGYTCDGERWWGSKTA